MRPLAAILGLVMALCCGAPRRAETADIDQVRKYVDSPMGRYSSAFSGVYYVGSEDDFDYIAIKRSGQTVKVFRIGRGQLDLKARTAARWDGGGWKDITDLFPPPAN